MTSQDLSNTTRKPLKGLIKAKAKMPVRNNQGQCVICHRGGGVRRLPLGELASRLDARRLKKSGLIKP